MRIRRALCVLALASLSLTASAAPKVGDAAPDFTLTDLSGKPVKLSDFKGKHVVLEWTNPHCPYVGKHYDTGNMPALQQAYTAKAVTWLVINSTHAKHREYENEAGMTKWLNQKKAGPTLTLLDKESKVGKLYDARTTPHMYVIDPSGKLLFAGGIDDKRTYNHADVKTAKNFVRAALDESLAGKPVSVTTATPYGCTIKYP